MRKNLVSHLMTLLLSLSCSLTHAANEDNQQQRMVEGAKKEGKLVFYTSVETEFARVLTAGFEARYPFIKTDIFRSSHEQIFSRLNVERKAGSFAADVLTKRRHSDALEQGSV